MPILQGRKVGGAFGAAARAVSDLLSDQGRRQDLTGYAFNQPGQNSLEAGVAQNLENTRPGSTSPPSAAPGDIQGAMMPGFSDHTWNYWAASAAARTGFTAFASVTGAPNTYSFTGNTTTLDKGRGRPWTKAGLGFSVTKCGGFRIKGSLSYQQNYHYFDGVRRDPMAALCSCPGIPWQQGEILTGEIDNAAVSEISVGGILILYNGIPHPYPRTLEDLCGYVGLVPSEIWEAACSFTPGANAWGTAAQLDSVTTEDGWLDADSVYWILGFRPHLVNTNGFINFLNGLPAYWKSRQASIPFAAGAQAVTFDSTGLCLPYEPIGPFEGSFLPAVQALGTAATATTGALIIAKE